MDHSQQVLNAYPLISASLEVLLRLRHSEQNLSPRNTHIVSTEGMLASEFQQEAFYQTLDRLQENGECCVNF